MAQWSPPTRSDKAWWSKPWVLGVLGVGVLACLVIFVLFFFNPFGSGSYTEPDAKVRLTKVLRLYQVYVEKNRKGPANEQALRDFGKKLSSKERDEYLIGDDLETIFTSPRDNQKFVIVYNLKLDPGGPTRAVAWEATGKGGMRFVALANGYVEEYDEQTFKEYKK